MKDIIVFAEFYHKNGESLGHYWLNHTDTTERRTLGMRCTDTFQEGGSVLTCVVAKRGDYP